jgi:pimeloyl-ACP methyl ester carboxylesterase
MRDAIRHATFRPLAFSGLMFFLLTLTAGTYAQAPNTDVPTYAPGTVPALGIALDEFAYPYPVRFLPLTIDGQSVQMAYMDVPASGAANGQTVVLLHGKNFPGAYWQDTIRVLTQAGYRVIVPDQLGFLNKSSKPDIDYSFDLLAVNTAKLLDALGVGKIALVGHSTGGMLAVRFARTYPDRVTRLILEDPIGLEDYQQSIPPQTTETLLASEMTTTTDAYRAYVKHYFVTWKPAYEQFVAPRMRIALSGEFPRWARSSALQTQMIYQQPVRAEYHLLTMPTLLIVGQQDRTVVMAQYAPPAVRGTLGNYPSLSQAAVKEMPHGTLRIVPDCGHIPHLEQPTIFHTALLGFLKSGE